MKIGLVRHFKVKKGLPEKKFITQDELFSWFDEYDKADIQCQEVDLCGIVWEKCYASDLPRALKTAEKIYNGNIIAMEELREFQLLKLCKRDLNCRLYYG